MTKYLTSGIIVMVLFFVMAEASFAWLITSQCGSSGVAEFFGDAGALFTTEGCYPFRAFDVSGSLSPSERFDTRGTSTTTSSNTPRDLMLARGPSDATPPPVY